MEFNKYMHLERYGNLEVEGIEFGTCHIFPKLDGTNASVWKDLEGHVRAGSRNRNLSLEKDNAGFYGWVLENENLCNYLDDNPTHRLYGEWLVPHTLKSYREDAWRRFYIFDVEVAGELIPYEEYLPLIQKHGLDFTPLLGKVTNGSEDNLRKFLPKNNFMLEDGTGQGEGIVIKRYDYRNRFGRTCFAKIVTNEFKDQHVVTMGGPEVECLPVESRIADKYVTKPLVDKVVAKMILENEGWTSKNIPQLLSTVFYDLIKEETWNFLKEYKNPTINFNRLRACVYAQVKELRNDLF